MVECAHAVPASRPVATPVRQMRAVRRSASYYYLLSSCSQLRRGVDTATPERGLRFRFRAHNSDLAMQEALTKATVDEVELRVRMPSSGARAPAILTHASHARTRAGSITG